MYREEVNRDLLYVSVDLSGSGGGVEDGGAGGAQSPMAANDVMIAGFSDAILRFVAQRGDATQLQHVENIGRARGLVPSAADSANSGAPLAKSLSAVYQSAHESDPGVRRSAKAAGDVFNDEGLQFEPPSKAKKSEQTKQVCFSFLAFKF